MGKAVDFFKNAFGITTESKAAPSAGETPAIQNEPKPTELVTHNGATGDVRVIDASKIEYMRNYMGDLYGDVTPNVTRVAPNVAHINFVPNSLMSFRRNNTQPTAPGKARMESDYSFITAERAYEKEGIIRKYVATAAAKFSRAGFVPRINPLFPKQNAQNMFLKVMAEHQRIMRDSRLTWEEVKQNIGKELHEFGNTILLKRRTNDRKIRKLVLDDIVFYDAVVAMPDLAIDHYIRRPYVRPKPHSEDMYNGMINSMMMTSSVAGSSLSMRAHGEWAGYYGPGFMGYGLTPFGMTQIEEKLSLRDVIHIKYMGEKNAPFAMPPTMGLINDINDLRVLEENVVALGFQYGHPLLHVAVDLTGLNDPQAEAEINKTTRAVQDMLSVGFLATSKRVEPKLMYPNGTAVPIDKFLDYFNGRIEKEFDTSGLMLGNGEGAGRQAGETIESSANDIFQMVSLVAAETLQEQYFYDIYLSLLDSKATPEPIGPVKVFVEEIDRGRKAFRVNTLVNGVNYGTVTRDEFRDEIALHPLTEDQKKEISEYLAERAAKGQSGTANANPSNQHGITTPGTVKD